MLVPAMKVLMWTRRPKVTRYKLDRGMVFGLPFMKGEAEQPVLYHVTLVSAVVTLFYKPRLVDTKKPQGCQGDRDNHTYNSSA
jgi:hypothetical protein